MTDQPIPAATDPTSGTAGNATYPSTADLEAQLAAANARIAELEASETPPVASTPPTSPATPDTPTPATPAAPEPAPEPEPEPFTGKVGSIVQHTYRDDYLGAGGEDVTDTGVVVELAENGPRVAWFREISDPFENTSSLTVVE